MRTGRSQTVLTGKHASEDVKQDHAAQYHHALASAQWSGETKYSAVQ